jgi:hypothetical protein
VSLCLAPRPEPARTKQGGSAERFERLHPHAARPPARPASLARPRSTHPIKRYFISVTEEEICHGIFWRSPSELGGRAHAFRRTIGDLASQDPATPSLKSFLDMADGQPDAEAAQLRRSLQDEMLPAALEGLACLTAYPPLKWAPGGVDPADPAHAAYLRALLDDCCRVLLDSLDRAQDRLAVEPFPLADECKAHLLFARARSARYIPTSAGCAAARRIERHLSRGGGAALVVHGPSGSGKTYIMARAAARRAEARVGATVVRFLGTTPSSSSAHALLASLCAQLHAITAGPSRGAAGALPPCPEGFEDLCRYLADALRQWRWGPLALFLDSLDQLDDANGGRRLEWLPVDGLAATVRLVVSTLPDAPDPEVGRPLHCL